MKYFIKNNKIQSLNKIVLIKNGTQTICPTEDMVIADGWVEIKPTIPTEEELQEQSKDKEIHLLKSYLADTDYKIIKCIEAYLCGEELPYDIHKLHSERDEYRKQINTLQKIN